NFTGSTVSVLRNTSSIGTIGLAPGETFAAGAYPFQLVAADVDGDGLADLAVADSHAVSVLVNATAVDTTITAHPSDPTNSTAARSSAARARRSTSGWARGGITSRSSRSTRRGTPTRRRRCSAGGSI